MNNQRNTPLVRPTTVGRSLLDFFGAPFSRSAAARPMQSGLLSSPQDFRQPSMGRDLMAMLGGPKTNPLSKLEDYELVEIANFGDLALANAATRELQLREPRGLLGSESIRPATSESMNVASEPSPEFSVQSDFAPLPRPSLPRDSSVPSSSSGLLGSIGAGLSGAASELRGLFSGEEGQARARALSKSLLSGPSATPIRFGQKIAEGLAGGQDEIEAQEKRKYLKEQMEEKRLESRARKEFKDAVKTDDDDKIDKAFKKAYPLEWKKSQTKNQTISDLKADAVRTVAFADANNIPRSKLPPSTIDLYNAATSTGAGQLSLEQIANASNLTPIAEPKNDASKGDVIEHEGKRYLVGESGDLTLIDQ